MTPSNRISMAINTRRTTVLTDRPKPYCRPKLGNGMTPIRRRFRGSLPVIGAALGVLLLCSFGRAEDEWTVRSPDGRLLVNVSLQAPQATADYPSDEQRLYYEITHQDVSVIELSPLGIIRDDHAFVGNLRFISQSEVETIDEVYVMPHGKRRRCHSHACQQVFTFSQQDGDALQLVVRVANDGVALRYVFSDQSDDVRSVVRELTGCRLPADTVAWMTPFQLPGKYTPSYEDIYLNGIPAGTASSSRTGWAFPALFKTPAQRWVLVTEAAVDSGYCGTRLAAESPQRVYRFSLPDPAEGAGLGSIFPESALPWTLPWRVFLVSDRLGDLVESTLVNDLNPASRIVDTSWIRPGRVAWSWWSDHDSPRDFDKQARFIDLAADMGWEYYLVDANWTLMDGGDVRQLIDYGKQKNVDVLLWYNSGGEHNSVTEKPRGCMKNRDVRRFEFEMLQRWGVKGVKVDFFQSDKQDTIQQYLEILQDAADFQLLINFHGCTVPRGWSRTWPNLISMEAVKGEECYSFDRKYPEIAPRYNTIIPYTRGIVGPTDLTPCAFSDSVYPHLTTAAHELALSVVMECGLVHFADSVEAYRGLPEAPQQFLRDVPAAWDETRWLTGYPGRFVAIARRQGEGWFLGAINGREQPLEMTLATDFLPAGRYQVQLIGDGKDARSFGQREFEVSRGDSIRISTRPFGGAVIRCTPTK